MSDLELRNLFQATIERSLSATEMKLNISHLSLIFDTTQLRQESAIPQSDPTSNACREPEGFIFWLHWLPFTDENPVRLSSQRHKGSCSQFDPSPALPHYAVIGRDSRRRTATSLLLSLFYSIHSISLRRRSLPLHRRLSECQAAYQECENPQWTTTRNPS